MKSWKQLAGASVDVMLCSVENTALHINHADPSVRFVAMQMLTYYWQPSQQSASIFEQLLANDPDPANRSQAMYSLGFVYMKTDNPAIKRKLAAIVDNDRETNEIRKVAYLILLRVCGIIDTRLESLCRAGLAIRIPEDVNWDIIISVK
jgi:hypothetical protein